ncbi:MAG TPA: nucleotidyltransferase family protein [Thermoanaerobaculia bacterium]|nr:nucleotidyltransferase family protein [Thermoanaerobaculia bacterium]
MSIVILAAGASKRLGHPKQLVEIDGETLLARAVRIARAVAPTIVVTRREFASAKDIVNEHAEEGMASSIRLGVAACDGDVLLMTCDQPHVTAAHLRALIDARAPIAATAYAGIAGVPAFFAKEFREELLALRGDVGARSIIEAHREVVAAIPLPEAELDVD